MRVRVRVRASAITVTLLGARSNRATLSLSLTLNSYPPLVSRFAFLSDDERTLFPQVGAYIAMMQDLLAVSREKLVAKGYPMDP